MKKLFSTLLLLVALVLPAKASPGCAFYWSPLTAFFQTGGSVTVVHPDGSNYSIYGGNVESGAQYGLQNGDSIFIYPPTCAVWYWGWTYFCPCNSFGGVTCGPPVAQQVGSAEFVQLSAWENCQCPDGSSGAGLTFVYQKYCAFHPPPKTHRVP